MELPMAELSEAALPFMESGGGWQHHEVLTWFWVQLLVSWLAMNRFFISLCPALSSVKRAWQQHLPVGVVVVVNGATVG